MKRLTAKEEAAIIRARSNAYHETDMTHEEFSAGQNESWARVEARSPRFRLEVLGYVLGRTDDGQ